MYDQKIKKIKEEIKNFKIKTSQDLETFKGQFIGRKKGMITELFKEIKNLSLEKRKDYGKILNELKKYVKKKINHVVHKKSFFPSSKGIEFDPTIPGEYSEIGSMHPLSIIKERIIEIFMNIGFSYIEDREMEDDWHNFTALNIPPLHPSRDMQDTFFLGEKNFVLRTHTSSVQIRYMKTHNPPVRILSIGKVYRNETVSSHSHFMFHQAEGFYIDKNVSFSDLKHTIQYMIHSIFGKKKVRFRSSYFPFTEPSAEIDVFHNNEWIEIMGCGMIDPHVLKNVNIDSEVYSGFAFGIGIERISCIIHQIQDIRTYFDNDLRFLRQFTSDF
nr:phenylalanine--tRNA ligase subunit alpha [Blattabacterium cuenoti]